MIKKVKLPMCLFGVGCQIVCHQHFPVFVFKEHFTNF